MKNTLISKIKSLGWIDLVLWMAPIVLIALASCSPPPSACKAKVKAVKASISHHNFYK